MENYLTKKGENRFKEKVRLANGKMLTKSFRTKGHAVIWKRKMETVRSQNILGIKTLKSILFEDIAARWFGSKVEYSLAVKTVATYRYALNAQVLPQLGKLNIAQITLSDIESLKEKFQRSGLKAKTINRVVTIIRQVFLYALDLGHIAELPFKKTLLLKSEKRSFSYFTELEIKSLLIENRESPIFPILFLALNSGMRKGEILGLCWDRVNFVSGKIEITRTLHARNFLQEKTKGGKARYFPMNDSLRAFFIELRKNQTSPIYVFSDKKGNAFNPDHYSGRNFKTACEKARVRKLRFHDMRHTYASHFMMRGGKIYDLKELLGHSDIKTTEIYAHLSVDHLKDVSQIVDFGISFTQEKVSGPYLALAGSDI